jgi:hypothetical protein
MMRFLTLFFLFPVSLLPVIRILTFHYNQADFIEMQYKTFQKFLTEDFEMIVFNDAKTEQNEREIEAICKKYAIKHVRFDPLWHLSDPLNQEIKDWLQNPANTLVWGWNNQTTFNQIIENPSVRHSHVIQYALEGYGYPHDDIVILMDGDNLLIRPLSAYAMLANHDVALSSRVVDFEGIARKHSRVSFPIKDGMPAPIFVIFHPQKIPDIKNFKMAVSVVHNFPGLKGPTLADTGSALYDYFNKHPNMRVKSFYQTDSGIYREYFSAWALKHSGFSPQLIEFIRNIHPQNVQFYAAEHFLHFSGVSGEIPGHQVKMLYLRQFINQILEDNTEFFNQ